ncbi:hypothetical protein ZWY2020_056892 [Hordeum vulgare]|nr:hypothetical protein ZWY2020_056892 [Hordeum vulgare]
MQDNGDSSSSSADPAMYNGYAGQAYAYGGGYPPMGSHPVNTMGGNLIIVRTADGGRQEERMRWGQNTVRISFDYKLAAAQLPNAKIFECQEYCGIIKIPK